MSHADPLAPLHLATAAGLPAGAGGKALSLARMAAAGIPVPQTLFLPQAAYVRFVQENDLAGSIEALAGDGVDELRWEEVWDATLALRNAFLRSPMPDVLARPLLAAVAAHFGEAPLAVRSCAPEEDAGFSHAGMHDSVLDVAGAEALLRAVRLVWASLWTDRAVLYRREMGLDPRSSGMGVLLQPMAPGEISGVMFTASPMDESQCLIEAVRGSARLVVDDAEETERTTLSRRDGRLLMRKDVGAPVLDETFAGRLFALGREVEELFGAPQDVEWTAQGGDVTLLQARPVTTLARSGNDSGWDAEDKRPWYLSLTRSHASLLALRQRIEQEILPGMLQESEAMKAMDLAALDCPALEAELERRRQRLEHWRTAYWRELIPFAHAVRQFGMLYNDALAPQDPFEFATLLTGQELLALERNALLAELAELVRQDPALAEALHSGVLPEEGAYAEKLAAFMESFGDLSCHSSWCDEGPWGIIRLTLEGFPGNAPRVQPPRAAELERRFLEAFGPQRRDFAGEVLELARCSYRLRDNDNIYLGKIQARYDEAHEQGRACGLEALQTPPEARSAMPKGLPWRQEAAQDGRRLELHGWAAAAGLARGPARVVTAPRDLFDFRKGEVLVCDALDPNMTFVAPLAAAIVERRGGMLVHGAIIAREYGIPCVTGIPDVTARIKNGEHLLVDGFRGLVALEQEGDALPQDAVPARNIFGGELRACCARPMTGFYRTGACETGPQDRGSHVVCARVTREFLDFTRARGNDLVTPAPQWGFPGLAPGDTWCLCALRWEEARKAGVAPPVLLEATHEAALRFLSLQDLQDHAAQTGNEAGA